ncbi:hypothetical protein B2G71_09675 [Novosphingobium sp. PC22D]|uniref:MarR family winged helix-turn-helix transcriptional regulator n=1 Tax=Novosphingobium sp. PC22D TaxID=1962403 RepID=UPI000BEF8471|nr:MarR family winged helix-turn-helix transcriptional regulator [Novosphingobium sp. PC22D]PEQ13079.1 hypothetical protein B2G71_09675 [Novosphingobium sp. PC22D]
MPSKSDTRSDPEGSEDDLETGNHWIDDYIPYKLYKVTSLLNMRLHKRLKANGVNLSQWRILSVLRAYGRLTLSQIIDYTLMEQPTVSRVVVQLEQEGIVTRHSNAEDSRIVEVVITRKGADTFNDIVPTAIRHQRIAFETLPCEELETFGKVLRRIERNIAEDF